MRISDQNHAATKPSPINTSAPKGEYGPLPAAHPFYDVVERVMSEWTHLEHALDTIICDLAVVDPRLGFCITGQLTGHWPRINAITAIAAAKSLDRTLIAEFELLGSRLSRLDKKKNSFFRQVWSGHGFRKSAQLVNFSAANERVPDVSHSSMDGTLDLISLMQAEIIVLWEFRSRLRSEAPYS